MRYRRLNKSSDYLTSSLMTYRDYSKINFSFLLHQSIPATICTMLSFCNKENANKKVGTLGITECTENIEGGLELIRVEEDYEEEDESVAKFMILWRRHILHIILQTKLEDVLE